MKISLKRELDKEAGLTFAAVLDVYDGAGSENGVFDVDEEGNKTPNGKVWIEAPIQTYRKRGDGTLVAKNRFSLIERKDYWTEQETWFNPDGSI